ncbi:hypothetical protein [Halolamina sp.]|jgi:hypothetical protein|uniref:DUF7331 family protein n=1 Tax=Halolamina sp. TaxID=1940283 RepID=UPI000223B743|nr:hypothetical protein Halar_1309 [halophilic archaeon DL31]
MVNHDGSRPRASSGDRMEPTTEPGFETVESYDVEDGIVLYDAENPLAWVRTDGPVALEDRR